LIKLALDMNERRKSDPVQYIKNSINRVNSKNRLERGIERRDDKENLENDNPYHDESCEDLREMAKNINYGGLSTRKSHDEHRLGNKGKTKSESRTMKPKLTNPLRDSFRMDDNTNRRITRNDNIKAEKKKTCTIAGPAQAKKTLNPLQNPNQHPVPNPLSKTLILLRLIQK